MICGRAESDLLKPAENRAEALAEPFAEGAEALSETRRKPCGSSAEALRKGIPSPYGRGGPVRGPPQSLGRTSEEKKEFENEKCE